MRLTEVYFVPGVNVVSGESRSFASVLDALRTMTSFKVDYAARKSPVWHRHFDVARLRSALPTVQLTPFEQALRVTLDAARAPSP